MHNPSRAQSLSGDVHVRYRRTDSIGERVLETAVALLSDEERVRYERFRVDRDRREFAVAHALLRTTLAELGDRPPGDWRFQTGSHGKPMLAAGTSTAPWSFNLSHARGLVACAVARGAEVGLDVELATRATNWRGIASRYFSAAEVAQIDRLGHGERPTRFFELWTLKEAFAKALGVGLSQGLDATTFELASPGAIACTLPPGVIRATWQFALYAPTREHCLAVAVSDGSPRRWRILARRSGGAGQPLIATKTSAG